MRRFSLVLCGGILTLLAITLMAAGQEQQKKGGKGGKGGFGGFGGGFGGGGMTDPVLLLRNESVKKELDITTEQSEKIPTAVAKALKEVLSDKQYKRLRQIELQQLGNAAFKQADVKTELKLTDSQLKNIDAVLEESRKEIAELQKDAAGDFKGMREKMTNLRKDTKEKVRNVLTADQRKSYDAMLGEEFKLQTGFGGGKGGTKKKDAQ